MYKALRYFEPLNPEKMMLHRDPGKSDGLSLTILAEGTDSIRAYHGVSVRRAFPISGADHMVTFVDRDGNEIGVLLDPAQLDPASLQALDAEMELAYFVPRITKIIDLKDEYGLRTWQVETDRGPREFATQSRYDVRPVSKTRYFIRDVDGNRYEISDTRSLDPKSRSKLDLEL